MQKQIIALLLVLVGFSGLAFGWIIGRTRLPYAPTYRVTPMSGGMMMGHGAAIRSDSDFIMEMIPHHEEAVETSRYVLARTNDPELMGFLQGIITAQTREIDQMKRWHQEWFGTEYTNDGRYRAMMPDLTKLTDSQLVPVYLHGMIMHHMGAVDMARAIAVITQRDELKSFSFEIIQVQTQEIETMLGWLTGFAGGPMPMMHGIMH